MTSSNFSQVGLEFLAKAQMFTTSEINLVFGLRMAITIHIHPQFNVPKLIKIGHVTINVKAISHPQQ